MTIQKRASQTGTIEICKWRVRIKLSFNKASTIKTKTRNGGMRCLYTRI